MKYQRLSNEDLKLLENEFIEFLIINGIDADTWQNLKLDDMAKTEKILLQFSDVIWEGVLRKNSYLKKTTPDKTFLFKCENKIFHTKIIEKQNDDKFKITVGRKSVTDREIEMFKLILQGCEIDKEALFENIE